MLIAAMKTANTKNVKNSKTIAVVIAVGLVISVVSSRAQSLNLSGTLEGSTSSELVGVGFFPAGNAGANDGEITSWVVSDSALDPNGLVFVYQASNNGFDAIDQVELTGFQYNQVLSTGTYSSLTGSLLLPGASTPNSQGNFPTPDVFGGTVTFENGQLPNGNAESYFLVVDTDVNNFTQNYGQIQDDFTAIGNILAPATVPEPSSFSLLAGLGCLFGVFRLGRKALKA